LSTRVDNLSATSKRVHSAGESNHDHIQNPPRPLSLPADSVLRRHRLPVCLRPFCFHLRRQIRAGHCGRWSCGRSMQASHGLPLTFWCTASLPHADNGFGFGSAYMARRILRDRVQQGST
jgi:hypothetical protein